MTLIDKILIKFHDLLRFKKLNPPNNFVLNESIEENKSNSNINLFKKAIDEHLELKEVIWIGIHHCLNTKGLKNEYLTVVDKNFKLICDLIEGDENSVNIPDEIKNQILDGKVLATFHNHFDGAVIPSSKDLKNTVLFLVKFLVITSENNIGIIINNYNNFDYELLKQEWILFLTYINWLFNNDMATEIDELYELNLNEKELEIEEQILFNKFISLNLKKFIREFNNRMEKFNVCFLHMCIMEE